MCGYEIFRDTNFLLHEAYIDSLLRRAYGDSLNLSEVWSQKKSILNGDFLLIVEAGE